MKELIIDCRRLGEVADFYKVFKKELSLSDTFGDNLDALFDTISGNLEMPLSLELKKVSMSQLETFDGLIATLEEAAEEVQGFTFAYYLQK